MGSPALHTHLSRLLPRCYRDHDAKCMRVLSGWWACAQWFVYHTLQAIYIRNMLEQGWNVEVDESICCRQSRDTSKDACPAATTMG
jgi:hypothetical protein